jgi:hypothetical protein
MSKTILFLSLFAILSVESFSQIIFENGYFINDLNQKTECLIRNTDWKNNPTKFKYKLSQDGNIETAFLQDVNEFGIYGASKYIRALVNIDKSSNNIADLTSDRNPTFQKELLFLKVLIEGRATLYMYEDGNLTRFFYKTNDSEIIQLVYRRYLINFQIAENNNFRQQLFNELSGQEKNVNDIGNMRYSRSELETFFIKYNKTINSNYVDYKSVKKRDLFNLTIRAGLNSSDLKIKNPELNFCNNEYGNKINYRFGVETEFILPYNKNKWSIIIEPTFQYYKSEIKKETNDVWGGFLISKVNYWSIELPVGLRHYFYLNDKSKIFANISGTINLKNSSYIELTRLDDSPLFLLEIGSRPSATFGIGYKYKNNFSLEMQYKFKHDILVNYTNWSSSYETFSLIFGYTIF